MTTHRSPGIAAVVVMLVTLLIPSTLVAQSPPAAIALEQVTESGYGITSVAPVGWAPVGPGLRARRSTATDPTLLALQSAPMAIGSLWSSLLPQLGLSEEPEAIDLRSTDAGLDWSLYQAPNDATGTVADLALAEDDGRTLLVLLVASGDEGPTLREAVFLPAVDAFALVPDDPGPGASGEAPPYAAEEVAFAGGAEDVTLAGTLTLPEGSGPFPAVALLSGSGPQDRDESLAPVAAIKPFALIADALTRAGVAVLRYDDRGVGRSTGDFGAAAIPDFTADGAAAVAYLRTRPEVDPERVGVLGHSEGGIEVATLAAQDPTIAFVVALAGPATKGIDLMVAQNEAIVRSGGQPEGEVSYAGEYARAVYAEAIERDRAGVEQVIRDFFGALYDRQPSAVQEQLGDRESYVQSQIDAQVAVMLSDWFVSLLESDAGLDWAQVEAPVLGIYGGKDVQVPAKQQAPALSAALDKAGNTDHEVVTLPDANHLFQFAETGSVAEYGSLEQTFTPDLLPTLVEWVTDQAGVAR